MSSINEKYQLILDKLCNCICYFSILINMRHILILISFALLTTSCGTFKVSTLNYDPIYDSNGNEIEVTVIKSQGQFDRLLRTDFTFRYNYAQYALSQPRSFDWNNRVLGYRNNFYNPYGFNMWGTSYWNRDQMWNDWVWGYTGWNSWGSPHRWSPFGYDRWGYNIHYGWNNHGWGYYGNGWNNYYGNGWNNYYGQNNWYGRRGRNNVSYINGRRGSISNEVITNRRVNTNKPRTIKNNNDVVINKEIIKLRRNNPNIRIINNPSNNNIKPRGYSRPELNNNNRNNNNTRPVIRNNSRPNTNTRSNNNVTPTRVSPQRNSRGPVRVKRNQ